MAAWYLRKKQHGTDTLPPESTRHPVVLLDLRTRTLLLPPCPASRCHSCSERRPPNAGSPTRGSSMVECPRRRLRRTACEAMTARTCDAPMVTLQGRTKGPTRVLSCRSCCSARVAAPAGACRAVGRLLHIPLPPFHVPAGYDRGCGTTWIARAERIRPLWQRGGVNVSVHGACLCYKVCVQVQGASNCTCGVRQ